MEIYAHTRSNAPEEEWELLVEHAKRVALRAEDFCRWIAPGFGLALGYLHDAGKYQPDFQAYLRKNAEAYDEGSTRNGKVPHSVVGAAWAIGNARGLGPLLAFPIAAHHGALHDKSGLLGLLARSPHRLRDAIAGGLDQELLRANLPVDLPTWAQKDSKAAALGVRMLLSTLADADMLESEAWQMRRQRAVEHPPLVQFLYTLESALETRNGLAGEKSSSATKLSKLRAEVSDACRDAAQGPVGRFRLTVPTGGGKTLSGLRFALHHAVRHGLERIIVVIPYTSILEQTVRVYRGLFDAIDPNAVIEHHSSLDPSGESQEHRWACENWDAPIIVTTSVQFFESLYAHHKRRCRKLHRVANSVVLLDEVQTFPLELLDPIQMALDHLATYFHSSVVSMTATQPLLQRDVEREIVRAPAALYTAVRGRFRVEWLGEPDTPVSWDAVVERATAEERVLMIVHTRKDAELVASMLGPDCVHLSARMCAAHRLAVIATIRQRLRQFGPCRVVATQLVEAGVDLDFPVVMRAFAGLDTLAQAAGRCNREFAPEPGRFVIFRAPTRPPAPSLVAGLNASQQLCGEGRFDLNDPALFAVYTARVLQTRPRDPKDVLGKEEALEFPAVAASFRMIDSGGATVIVPYEDGWNRVQQMRLEVPVGDRRRSTAPWRAHRHPCRSSYLESEPSVSSPSALSYPCWRAGSRSLQLGGYETPRLLPPSARAQPHVPGQAAQLSEAKLPQRRAMFHRQGSCTVHPAHLLLAARRPET